VLAIVVVVAFSFCLTWTRQARVSCGLAVLGVWAACGAVKVNLRRRQGGGFRQTGSVLSVAVFGAADRHGSPKS